MINKFYIHMFLYVLFTVLIVVSCSDIKDVSFSKDVQPILIENCYPCHSGEETQGNIHLDSFERLMKSRYLNHTNPIVIAGDPKNSRLYIVVSSNSTGIRMPPASFGYDNLNESDILTIQTWIKEGAKNN